MNIRQSVSSAVLIAGIVCMSAAASVHADEHGSARSTKSQRSEAKAVKLDARRRMNDQPYEFRGIPLGITLDEFRIGQPARATPPGSEPVCETDVMAGALGMGMKTDNSLTVACRWAHRTGEGWQLSRAVVDGSPAQDHVMRFARVGSDASFRLYEISFVIDEITASDLRTVLADRYGAPRMQTAAVSAGSAGRSMAVYVWENAVSSITLCFLPGTRSGTLTYLLKDPDAWVKSVARQWQASNPDAG